MIDNPEKIASRTVAEWTFSTLKQYENPFIDVKVDVEFVRPDGAVLLMPAFYDGDQTWKVRFNPGRPGKWIYRVVSRPNNPDFDLSGHFEVGDQKTKGFLRSVPGKNWGFEYESGEPAFLLGDTVYNLFGADFCGLDVPAFLERRARQGFNLLRVRLPVSPFHPPAGYSAWQTRRTWPWGGSEQAPRFDQFNLEYFHTVDKVVAQAEQLGVGLEMIMEAYGFEFPFNSRNIFVPEWEELWLRYLIARYDAFNAVYFWTPMNEYEYYPNGDWHYKPVADLWAMRIARWIKEIAPHGHILSIHNGPVMPAFAKRFAADPQAIDTIMFQAWGTVGQEDSWLAGGIEEQIGGSFKDWGGTAVFAEYGYERNPEFELLVPGHIFCDEEHTRRGAWRGAFCALPVIHGFENSWGPWQILDRDQPGLVYLQHLRDFFTRIVPFNDLKPAPELISSAPAPVGFRPKILANSSRSTICVYLPVGGSVSLILPDGVDFQGQWFDPRTGELNPTGSHYSGKMTLTAPEGGKSHPWDWVLVLKA